MEEPISNEELEELEAIGAGDVDGGRGVEGALVDDEAAVEALVDDEAAVEALVDDEAAVDATDARDKATGM